MSRLIERMAIAQPNPEPETDPTAEMMVLIDGAHIRAAYGYQSLHVDVTVDKIEVTGKLPRRLTMSWPECAIWRRRWRI